MLLDYSTPKYVLKFEITEDEKRQVQLLELRSVGELPVSDLKPTPCNIAQIHVPGENQNDHHGAKHMGNSGGLSLSYVSHRAIPMDDGMELEFLLSDGRMNATIHYRLYDDISAVRAWTEVENIADEPLGLDYVASFAFSGIDAGAPLVTDELRVYVPYNGWVREANWRAFSMSDLGLLHIKGSSTQRICFSNSGTWSTKERLPMGAFQNNFANTTWLWQIENNGSWQWEIEDHSLFLSGPTEQENHWYRALKKGERFESVKVCVTLGQSFDDALAEMTRYRRKIIHNNPENAALPVIFNDYMNCLFADPTEEKELPVIDAAAKAGAEYYCIDAGWYADGGWWETVGEWKECARRFPNGLRALCDYIRKKGMVPGLWVEIEVMGIHCPLAKEFPDECFFMRHGKRVIDHGRYQLDFRHPKVQEYASEVMDRLISDYGVGYFKIDYNIDGGVGTEVNADSFGDGLLGHNRAYLDWLRTLKKKYPSLVLECCSSGGLRMDYAMLSEGHLQSVSDATNYRNNAFIAAAAPTAVLPEQGAIWSYPLKEAENDAVVVNMINSMLQRIHLSGKITGQTEEGFALIREGIECYKSIRRDIPQSTPFYPLGLPVYGDGWACLAFRTPHAIRMSVWRLDGEEACLTVPLEGMGDDVRVLYPSTFDGKAEAVEGGVCVTLPRKNTAVLLECK